MVAPAGPHTPMSTKIGDDAIRHDAGIAEVAAVTLDKDGMEGGEGFLNRYGSSQNNGHGLDKYLGCYWQLLATMGSLSLSLVGKPPKYILSSVLDNF